MVYCLHTVRYCNLAQRGNHGIKCKTTTNKRFVSKLCQAMAGNSIGFVSNNFHHFCIEYIY